MDLGNDLGKNFTENESHSLIEPRVKVLCSTIDHHTWIRRETTLVNSTIGNDVFIGFRCTIENAYVEPEVQIASKVTIGNRDHLTIVKKHAWIGAGSCIEGGITIGEGAVVGAGSKVYEDVPPYSIVVGNPARLLKERKIEKDKVPEFRSFLEIQQRIHKQSDVMKMEKRHPLDDRCPFIDADLKVQETPMIGEKVIMIGKRIYSESGSLITDGGITIGDQVILGDNTIIEGGGNVSIGNNTIIGKDVLILSTTHDYTKLSLPMVKMPVFIGDDVTIEDHTIILGGVTIRSGTHIKANSLIIKSI
ncbi:DapH/DapD/GlmU-related protein [Bacillus swezeyi]|uniref:acyltransferase n=1 Tax=Bacillus swezeyi TaxID=1925020 RepID=UPI002E1D618F|nr:DapH/DapD/GlmU-related protein [Bacillus swezeyi]